MQFGIVAIPTVREADGLIDRTITFAQRVESLGYSGLWTTDAFGRGFPTVDPLMFLSTLCNETKTIELGTCVVQVPIRHPVELAHRVQTLNLLSRGRLRLGVGSGSTKHDFDTVQVDYARRFKLLPENLAVMRKVWAAEPVYGPAHSVWRGTEGGPPVYIGAWRSQRWIDFAVQQCEGWIASGIHGEIDDLPIGLDMFRKAGGKRAILANVFTDLRPDPPHVPAHAKVTLICGKAEARDRLRRIADIGFDDVLLIVPMSAPDMLDELRELLP